MKSFFNIQVPAVINGPLRNFFKLIIWVKYISLCDTASENFFYILHFYMYLSNIFCARKYQSKMGEKKNFIMQFETLVKERTMKHNIVVKEITLSCLSHSFFLLFSLTHRKHLIAALSLFHLLLVAASQSISRRNEKMFFHDAT